MGDKMGEQERDEETAQREQEGEARMPEVEERVTPENRCDLAAGHPSLIVTWCEGGEVGTVGSLRWL